MRHPGLTYRRSSAPPGQPLVGPPLGNPVPPAAVQRPPVVAREEERLLVFRDCQPQPPGVHRHRLRARARVCVCVVVSKAFRKTGVFRVKGFELVERRGFGEMLGERTRGRERSSTSMQTICILRIVSSFLNYRTSLRVSSERIEGLKGFGKPMNVWGTRGRERFHPHANDHRTNEHTPSRRDRTGCVHNAPRPCIFA